MQIKISRRSRRCQSESCSSLWSSSCSRRQQELIGHQILKEIRARLSVFLSNVGLEYLSLARATGTLVRRRGAADSSGDADWLRVWSVWRYILDEPSIGLHQRDNDKLLSTLNSLRDLGNTLIVVEHDEDTMRAADFIVDVGPGAGEHGGHSCGNRYGWRI